jgi:hypothetical protein
VVLADFRTQYPEFNSISDSYVQAKLDQATSHISSTAFGAHFDEAHGLSTAQLLWESPFGASMRLDSNGNEVEGQYQKQLERLSTLVIDTSCVVTGCPRVR